MPSERFQLSQCRIQNMVAHVELPVGPGGTLDIQEMYARLGLNCTYQRRMFPGLLYRPEASPVVLLSPGGEVLKILSVGHCLNLILRTQENTVARNFCSFSSEALQSL